MSEYLGIATLVVGLVMGISGAVVWVANGRVRADRIDAQDGLIKTQSQRIDALESALAVEREECRESIARLEGQVETMSGDLGVKLGTKIGEHLAERIIDELDEYLTSKMLDLIKAARDDPRG